MDYNPITAVWEITMNCNMRCKHCGSRCQKAVADELTTEEALKLCDELGEMGFKWITLSGGEPTTRKDWHLIAKKLSDNGIIPTLITNGWLINEEILDQALNAGVNTIAISIDGLEKTHDYIRKKGSFQKIMEALDLMQKKGNTSSVITTIMNKNITELSQLKRILIEKNVTGWQLQLGLPMGNMLENREMLAEPDHVDKIIDFAYETMSEGKIEIQLADCIGYYNLKEIAVRKEQSGINTYIWQGCGAGKYNMGILHNGDILGCTSIRDRRFIEGNIKETPVKVIWKNPDSFAWNRQIKKQNLLGLCGKCLYGHYCLGGCSNTKITMGGSIYAENRYCSYHLAISKASKQLESLTSPVELKAKANLFINNRCYQLAELLLSKVLKNDSKDIEAQKLYGFVHFMLENYSEAKRINENILKSHPNDAYANKGLGLSLSKLGERNKGIEHLKKAIILDKNYMDPYYDLALVLIEDDKQEEALKVIKKGRKKSKDFRIKSQDLYERLHNQKNSAVNS